MNRIIALTLSISSLIFSPAAIVSWTARSLVAQPAITPATQVQPAQVEKRELIAVAASATQNKDYQLALRVANNVIGLFPDYANAYLYRAITLYELGSHEAAKVSFTKAKGLYERQLQSASLTAQEQKKANFGLETAELHLQLIESQL